MKEDTILIKNSIMHILDSNMGMPVFSDTFLEITPDLDEFIRGHIARLYKGDDLKKCYFEEGVSEVYDWIKEYNETDFLTLSKQLADKLYTILQQNVDIPSADLLIVNFKSENTTYLALLKLNYKETMTHFINSGEEGNETSIIKYQSTLPGGTSRLSEAVLINLSDYSVQIVEKKYEVNGAKCNYLSEHFLNCKARMSEKTKMAIVTKAVEQINKKHYEEDVDKQMEAKSIIKEELAIDGTLDVARVSAKIYGNEPDIKEEFEEKLDKYNMKDAIVEPKSEKTVKKFEKQFLKTDTGIEINIPMEEYNNTEHLEFISNPDGTVSLIIKNINHITTK